MVSVMSTLVPYKELGRQCGNECEAGEEDAASV